LGLSGTFAGRGVVRLMLTMDGWSANALDLRFR
jgi:hypothetical protein